MSAQRDGESEEGGGEAEARYHVAEVEEDHLL